MTRTEALALIKQHGGVRPAARALGIWPNNITRALKRTDPPSPFPKGGQGDFSDSAAKRQTSNVKRRSSLSLSDLRAKACPAKRVMDMIGTFAPEELRHESDVRAALEISDRAWRKLCAQPPVSDCCVTVRGIKNHPDGRYLARPADARAARAELRKASML